MRGTHAMYFAAGMTLIWVPSSSAEPSTTAGTPATPTAVPAATTAANANNPSPDTIICKSSPPETGTRFGAHRVCQTQRAWDNEQKDGQNFVKEQSNHGLLFSTPGN